MEPIHTIVYASSAVSPFSTEDLEDLLQIARANNTRLGITGLLLYAEGNFLQILEGDEKSVEDLFDHIEHDQRHRGIIRLITRRHASRSFSNWSMGFKRLQPKEFSEHLPGFNDLLNLEEPPEELRANVAKSIWTLLMSFRQVVNS